MVLPSSLLSGVAALSLLLCCTAVFRAAPDCARNRAEAATAGMSGGLARFFPALPRGTDSDRDFWGWDAMCSLMVPRSRQRLSAEKGRGFPLVQAWQLATPDGPVCATPHSSATTAAHPMASRSARSCTRRSGPPTGSLPAGSGTGAASAEPIVPGGGRRVPDLIGPGRGRRQRGAGLQGHQADRFGPRCRREQALGGGGQRCPSAPQARAEPGVATAQARVMAATAARKDELAMGEAS
jgi:hypothetical protein